MWLSCTYLTVVCTNKHVKRQPDFFVPHSGEKNNCGRTRVLWALSMRKITLVTNHLSKNYQNRTIQIDLLSTKEENTDAVA